MLVAQILRSLVRDQGLLLAWPLDSRKYLGDISVQRLAKHLEAAAISAVPLLDRQGYASRDFFCFLTVRFLALWRDDQPRRDAVLLFFEKLDLQPDIGRTLGMRKDILEPAVVGEKLDDFAVRDVEYQRLG